MGKVVKRSTNRSKLILCVISLIILLGILFFVFKGFTNLLSRVVSGESNKYLSSDSSEVQLYNLEYEEIITLPRGMLVTIKPDKVVDGQNEYYIIIYNNETYLVSKNNIVEKDTDIVKETEMYIRTASTLYESADSVEILGLINKGEKVEILDYDKVLESGNVNKYKVKYNDQEGYIYGKYVVNDHEKSLLNYDEEGIYTIHAKRTDTLLGGSGANLDYYPREKGNFENNKMPEEVRSLYLNGGSIRNLDGYIALAKQSGINAFVVDIKDNEVPAFPAKAMEKYSPTNYQRALNSYETYQKAIKKLKDEGFYVIGRITVFKDSYYAKDHPENTIKDNSTGGSFNHDGSYWPTGFSREVWEFNVSLAVEAVEEMGFNEIQFDYVRFPDRTINLEKQGVINFNNVYNEEKAQAIQRFLMYATDEIHAAGAYVSADVFGESAHRYVTAYGQYWPAISNVVDVISGMPYPDHFSKYEYEFKEVVWTVPYKLLKFWGEEYVMNRQKEIPSPAVVRTWIQVYNVTKSPSVVYDSYMVSEQIQGLYDAGLTGGFMTWDGGARLSKYTEVSAAFGKEY